MNTLTQRSERILSLFDENSAIPVSRFKGLRRGNTVYTPKGLKGRIVHMIALYDHVYCWVESCTSAWLKPGIPKYIHEGVPVEELL